MSSDKFFKIGFFVFLGVSVFFMIYGNSTKTYSSIPEHEKEIVSMIKRDDVFACDFCGEEKFSFELFRSDAGDYICLDCIPELLNEEE